MAKAELTGETLRGVSDDFDYLDENSAARAFLNGLAEAGSKVSGQTLFGLLDRNGSEYRNSTINMGDLGETYANYSMLDKAGLALGNAVYTAAAGAHYDLLPYEGTYDRAAFVGYLQANQNWSDIYADIGAEMFSNGDLQDELVAHGGYGSIAEVLDTSSEFEGLSAGLQVLNGKSIPLGRQVGIVTMSDILGDGINPDGTANVITKAFGHSLQGLGMASLAGALASRIPRAGGGRSFRGADDIPSGYTRNVDGSITGPAGGQAWDTGYVNARGQQVFQRATGGYYVVSGNGTQVRVASPKVHGNTLDNTPTEIYQRVSEFDNIYQKTGIANDAMRRYAVDELGGDIIIPLGTRPRVQAAAIERFIVERWPGPLNREPWAGKRNPGHPNYDPDYIPYHMRGN